MSDIPTPSDYIASLLKGSYFDKVCTSACLQAHVRNYPRADIFKVWLSATCGYRGVGTLVVDLRAFERSSSLPVQRARDEEEDEKLSSKINDTLKNVPIRLKLTPDWRENLEPGKFYVAGEGYFVGLEIEFPRGRPSWLTPVDATRLNTRPHLPWGAFIDPEKLGPCERVVKRLETYHRERAELNRQAYLLSEQQAQLEREQDALLAAIAAQAA